MNQTCTKLYRKNTCYSQIARDLISEHEGDQAFFIVDLGKLDELYQKWVDLLPRVRPFYAVKSNNDNLILERLHRLGCGFDAASSKEIDQVLRLGVEPKDIIFANPAKIPKMIIHALEKKVDLTTFESESELRKIKAVGSDMRLLLRMRVQGGKSLVDLGLKYGCSVSEGKVLLEQAKELGLTVIGVAFHAGSDCKSPESFSQAIADCKALFNHGDSLGFQMTLLDIGGGYPAAGSTSVSFERIAREINSALDGYFPDEKYSIMAEPGRYFSSSSSVLVCQVFGKKSQVYGGEVYKTYFVNCSAHGALIDSIFLEPHLTANNTRVLNPYHGPLFKSVVRGSSTHSDDIVGEGLMLPDLEAGEHLLVTDMGAYTLVMYPQFEDHFGCGEPSSYYVDRE